MSDILTSIAPTITYPPRPDRRQCQRRAGWRAPAGARYVGRGLGEHGKFGNPFHAGVRPGYGDRLIALALFRVNLLRREQGEPHDLPDTYPTFAVIRAELAGRTLLCWCPDGHPCHGEPLWWIANGFGLYGSIL